MSEDVVTYSSPFSAVVLRLREDEAHWISSNDTRRCSECGHLSILHNEHCCVFCMVPGCECRWNWQSDCGKEEV